MGEKKKLTNITVYRKKPHLNIGIFIFGIIFIYLAFSVLMYLTSGPVSVYEVRKGSILRDTAYTGFVVRNETVVTAPAMSIILSQKEKRLAQKPAFMPLLLRNWISRPGIKILPENLLKKRSALFSQISRPSATIFRKIISRKYIQ